MNVFDFFKKCTGFEWNEQDTEEDWQRYRVTPSKCEEFFFNHPLVVADDVTHPGKRI